MKRKIVKKYDENLVLTETQAKQFYDLWIPLLDYVNRKYELFENLYGMESPRGLPLNAVAEISAKLWENLSIIDEYVGTTCKKMSREEIAIISSWKKAVRGNFLVERHLEMGSVLINMKDEEVYIVKGIYSSLKEISQSFSFPYILQTTLIPYQNSIIYDSIVYPQRICFGRNIAEEASRIFLEAQKNKRLHFSL